jgi:adenylate kinase family enzyme
MKIILLVGPPGSGKTTYAQQYIQEGYTYINQDLQGKDHLRLFEEATSLNKNIVVDRMNFNKNQRDRYYKEGYERKIVVLHVPREECLRRCTLRTGHPTNKDEASANAALNTFFSKYERPSIHSGEGHNTEFVYVYPQGTKDYVVWCDIDGTVADVSHRLGYVRGERKNWNMFFQEMTKDLPNVPVVLAVESLAEQYPIVYCSGRPDTYKKQTREWLNKYCPSGDLYMRLRSDSRKDDIVKENILDFEILTRYKVLVCFDDRDQVVKMLRKRGQTVFQVAEGDF